MADLPVAPNDTELDLRKQNPIYEKLAKFLLHGISSKSICESFGFSESRLSQIKSEKLFIDVQQLVIADASDALVETDSAWDRIEGKALHNIEQYLKFSRDPEMSLKIAVHANKAIRRTRPGNRPLEQSNAGKTVISLSKRMVEKLRATSQSGEMQESERATTVTATVAARDLQEALGRAEAADSVMTLDGFMEVAEDE